MIVATQPLYHADCLSRIILSYSDAIAVELRGDWVVGVCSRLVLGINVDERIVQRESVSTITGIASVRASITCPSHET